MKKNIRSARITSIFSIALIMLLALSYHSVIFACPNSTAQLHILDKNSRVDLAFGVSAQTVADEDELKTIIN